MEKEKILEEFKKWKNENFKKRLGIIDEKDIVSKDDLIFDDNQEE
ncbi:hypothetical protein [Fusobacterium varium]